MGHYFFDRRYQNFIGSIYTENEIKNPQIYIETGCVHKVFLRVEVRFYEGAFSRFSCYRFP